MADDETYFENDREYYKATGHPVWPSRHREHPSLKPGDQQHKGPLSDTQYVRMMLERLDKLERDTRPSAGPQTATGKDGAAFEALHFAGKLVEYVAGWAIDHQIGLALKQKRSVPLGTFQAKAHPEYVAERAAVDDHEHERAGGSRAALDPATQRAALINLLVANAGGFPGDVQYAAIDALEALEFEEVLPIIAPAEGNRKVKLMEMRMQLQVVGFVEFQIATGSRKYEALEMAEKVISASASTIAGWEYLLRKELGYLPVLRTLSRYANWGRSYKVMKQRWAAGQETDPEAYLMFEELGGLPALKVVAESYKSRKK